LIASLMNTISVSLGLIDIMKFLRQKN